MNEMLIEPLKYYETQGSEEHAKNCAEYYDRLLQESGVNVDENRKTVEGYNAEQDKIKALDKEIAKFKVIRALLIAAIVLGAILIIVAIYNFSNGDDGIALLLTGAAIIPISILVMVKKINPMIKDANLVRDGHLEQADRLYT